MRCPKCHYLSFDPEPRCRNCGYGLSLEESDLFIREDAEPASPFADLSLHRTPIAVVDEKPAVSAAPPAPPSPPPPVARTQSPFAALTETASPSTDREPVFLPPVAPRPRPAPTSELPLFVRGTSSAEAARVDEPLVRIPSEMRPLGVRRKPVEPVAPKPRPVSPPANRAPGPLDRDLLAVLQRLDGRARKPAETNRARIDSHAPFRAGPAKRLTAAAIDGAILGGLSIAIMWITLRWCGLPLDRALMLPVLLPTSALLLLVGVGYLVMFTAAGGQTLGKMAAGIRVVGDAPSPDQSGPLTVAQAVFRAVLTLPSVFVVGAGFVPALVGDERAVHDRLAHTRVVRA